MRRAILFALTPLLLAPAAAQAGEVTRSGAAITYTAAGDAGEKLTASTSSGKVVLASEIGVTTSDCDQDDDNTVSCDPPATSLLVNYLGMDDDFGAANLVGVTVEAHGGEGDDSIGGSPSGDRLFGEGGGDRIEAGPGDDLVDGGPGQDYLYGHVGDDNVVAGAGDDFIGDGPGRDTYSGGEGANDTLSYEEAVVPVTITLNGVADDGPQGEGDNAGADLESAIGGSGGDRIAGSGGGGYLTGNGGNDSITAGPGQDLVVGNDGDDTIDTRDGNFDSIDCGLGNDTVLADADDFTVNCEQAPDPDGDGFLADDCAPNDKTINPGAGEVFGNTVDEDCKDGPGYERIFDSISYKIKTKKRPKRVAQIPFTISLLQAGDTVVVSCKGGKKKGCPFKQKTRTVTGTQLNLAKVLKKRYLRPGAVVEIMHLRANFIGKVVRYRVKKDLSIKTTQLCLRPDATEPAACV